MIPAAKSAWFTAWFAGHARARIERTFGRVCVAGLDELRAACEAGPVLVVANHSSWWDPLVALWLTQRLLRADAFAMMDAANLRRLPFFNAVGAFGVDLDVPADGARAIRHAVRLLDRPGRLVWIYPEGGERSPFEPLEIRSGAALVGRLARRARLVAIGTRYVFRGDERPELWISIAPPEASERDVELGRTRQQQLLEGQLARIDRALATGNQADFAALLETRRSRVGWVAEAILTWLARRLRRLEPAAARDPQA